MGRPLPADIRAELQADADAYPISKERLASWSEWDGYAITRKTPEGEWLETFAPPGHPDPFNHRWFAEVDLGGGNVMGVNGVSSAARGGPFRSR